MQGYPRGGEIEEISWMDWGRWRWEHEGLGMGWMEGIVLKDDWKEKHFHGARETARNLQG